MGSVPAQQYRENTDECRRLAEGASLNYVRARFRELADHWQRLADEAEQLERQAKRDDLSVP
jgi:hypothetical protein